MRNPDTTDIALSIQTSDEEILKWDRNKIVDTLLRETTIQKDLAIKISLEVENQIKNCKTITTSLVRELTNAKLVEYGLEKERLQHDRLGVPLFDVEGLITNINCENSNVPHGPEATNLTLAGEIKKEYALRKIFSSDITMAHLKGDLHLHDLTMPDRPYCSGQSLEYVKKFGLNLPKSLSNAKPAKHAEVLLAHMVKFAASLQCHYAGAIGWDAINIFFAPYLVGLSKEKIYQIAQMLLFEFSQQAVARGGQAIFSDLNLYWEIPNHFENTPAIGPGGKYTGKLYKDYIKEAQDFVWAIFEVYKKGDGSGRPFLFPKPNFHITEKFFKTPGHKDFLLHVCEVASKMGNPYFLFDRGLTAKISECCRLSFKLTDNDLRDAKEPWHMRYCALQNVTINLPRIGLTATSDKLLDSITRVFNLVIKAHLQKYRFIKKILSLKENGPLALLAMDKDGETYLRLNRASFLIGMVGLNEMIKAQTGYEMHESEKAFKLGLKVIAHMKLLTEATAQKYGLHFVLEQTPAECNHYDQFIQLVINDEELKIVKIGEFIDKFLDKEGSYVVKENLKTLTINDDLKDEFLPVTRLFKHKRKSNVYKVTLASKREIKVTDCHSICVLEDGKIVSKPLYELKTGDYLIRSRNNPFENYQNTTITLNNKKIILDSKFSFFLGHLIGDGSISEKYISLRSTTKELIIYLKSIADNLFGEYIFSFRKMSFSKKQTKYCYEIICYNKDFIRNFKEALKLKSGCRNVKVPEIMLSASKNCIIYFLKALYLTDGSLYNNSNKKDKNIKISTSSIDLITGLYVLFSRLNIETRLCVLERHSETHNGMYYDLLLRGEDIDNFLQLIKDNNNFIPYKFYNKLSIRPCKKLPDISKLVAKVRKELDIPLSISLFDKYGIKNKFSMIRHAEKRIHATTFHGLKTVVDTYTSIENRLSKKSETLNILKNILNSNLVFDKILTMQKLEKQPKYVYDLEVADTHRFVNANGVLLHNSTAYRLAKLDVKYYERAKEIVQGTGNSIYYTNSTYFNIGADIDLITRVQKEGLFHPLIEAGALCLDYNELLPLYTDNNFEITKIGEFVENVLKNTTKKTILPDGSIQLALDKTIKTLGVTDKGKLVKISHVMKIPITNKKMFKITTNDRKQIKVTENHLLFKLINGEIKEVNSQELKKDDVILTQPEVLFKDIKYKINILDKLYKVAEKITVIDENKSIANYFKNNHINSPKSLYKTPGTICLKSLLSIAPEYSIEKNKDNLTWRYRNSTGKLPFTFDINYEFGLLIGLFLAEGHNSIYPSETCTEFTFHRRETEFINIVKTLFKRYLYEDLMFKQIDNYIQANIHNKTIFYLLSEIFDIGNCSLKRQIPKELFILNKEYLSGIVDGIFAGDGLKANKPNCTNIVITSDKLTTQLQLIFSIFGIKYTRSSWKSKNINSNLAHMLYVGSSGFKKLINITPLYSKYLNINTKSKIDRELITEESTPFNALYSKYLKGRSNIFVNTKKMINLSKKRNFCVSTALKYSNTWINFLTDLQTNSNLIRKIFKDKIASDTNISIYVVSKVLKTLEKKNSYCKNNYYSKTTYDKISNWSIDNVLLDISKDLKHLFSFNNYLKNLSFSSISLVEEINKDIEFAYDITVDGHKFSNLDGIVCHNTHIWLGESRPSPESLAVFVEKVFRNTKNDQIAFSPEFTTCNDCNRTERGLVDKCIHCNSKNIEQITRITGYFSKVSGWNKGKLAELKDRKRSSF